MNEVVFDQSPESVLTNETDVYPSRNGQSSKLVERQDPTVYAAKGTRPPIDQSLIDSYDKQGFVVLDDVFPPRRWTAFNKSWSASEQIRRLKLRRGHHRTEQQ